MRDPRGRHENVNPPDELSRALEDILRNVPALPPRLPQVERKRDFSTQDTELLDRMLQAMRDGADGIVLLRHPTGRLEYLIVNASRVQAIRVMSEAIQVNAERLQGR